VKQPSSGLSNKAMYDIILSIYNPALKDKYVTVKSIKKSITSRIPFSYGDSLRKSCIQMEKMTTTLGIVM